MHGIEILNTKQELNFLRDAMAKNEFLGNGASRAVYSLGNGFVIKVTMDDEGNNQSDLECEMYQKYGSEFLAKIIYKGIHTLVSEEVKTYSRYEVERIMTAYHKGEGRSNLSNAMCKKFVDTYKALSNMFGYDDDEYMQLGIASDGRVVAYDYGFRFNTNTSFCSYRLRDTINKVTPQKFPRYVEGLILNG